MVLFLKLFKSFRKLPTRLVLFSRCALWSLFYTLAAKVNFYSRIRARGVREE